MQMPSRRRADWNSSTMNKGRTAVHRMAVRVLMLTLAAVASVLPARADDFPARPLRVMIGFAPGSAADITARVVGEAMGKTLGQQVVVEARPGAGSSLAAEFEVR